MDILVTGATGFLGTRLSVHLESQGHRVVRVGSRNGDLTRADSLKRFNDRRFDQVYHLAAWTQAGDFCLRHPGEQWIINQQINTNVLSWWHQRQPQAKLIAIGTSCAYPVDRELVEANYLENYHAVSDTYDKVDFAQLKKHVAEAAEFSFALANLPEKIGPRFTRAQIEQSRHETGADQALKADGIWDDWESGRLGRKK